MTPPSFTTADSVADSGFIANLMPNRAYSRLWRGVAACIIFIGILVSIDPLTELLSELRARRAWSRADAHVASAHVLSAPENHSPGGSPSISNRRTMYWAEFHVHFRPSNGCRTGIEMGDTTIPFPCIGFIQTIPHYSQSSAYDWLGRHRSGSSTQILYDPVGSGVKFADESLLNVVRWDRTGLALLFFAIGAAILSAARRRLADLAYLPEGQDLLAPTRPSSSPDEFIDMKLS